MSRGPVTMDNTWENAHEVKNIKELGGSLREYLLNTEHDELFCRTTYPRMGWHDVEFTANRCGFSVGIGYYKPYQDNYTFAECYHFVRRKK